MPVALTGKAERLPCAAAWLEAEWISSVLLVVRRRGPVRDKLPRRLLFLADAARYLGASTWTVRQMVWRSDLPHIKCGKWTLLGLCNVDDWIEREKAQGL